MLLYCHDCGHTGEPPGRKIGSHFSKSEQNAVVPRFRVFVEQVVRRRNRLRFFFREFHRLISSGLLVIDSLKSKWVFSIFDFLFLLMGLPSWVFSFCRTRRWLHVVNGGSLLYWLSSLIILPTTQN